MSGAATGRIRRYPMTSLRPSLSFSVSSPHVSSLAVSGYPFRSAFARLLRVLGSTPIVPLSSALALPRVPSMSSSSIPVGFPSDDLHSTPASTPASFQRPRCGARFVSQRVQLPKVWVLRTRYIQIRHAIPCRVTHVNLLLSQAFRLSRQRALTRCFCLMAGRTL